MKKIIIFILIFTSSLLSLFAWQPLETKALQIQAGVDKALEINVEPIPAQTEFFLIGMPFNIEEDIVQYHSDDVGRRIATIDIISNTRFRMTVTSDGPMKHIENDGVRTVTSTPLNYILTFQFLLGYYEGGNINESATTTIRYRTAGSDTSWTIGASPDPETFLGTVDGTIYFMFDQAASAFIASSDDTSLRPGNYDSTVTIIVEAVE